MTPTRILDTRDGTGGFSDPLGPGASIDVPIGGQGGTPETGVGSVVLNLTATNATEHTHLTLYPTGRLQPVASNLNPAPGQSVANQAEVALGEGGKITVYNNSGSVDIIFDIAGWVADAPETGTQGLFRPLPPSRILDTRNGTGQPASGAVGPDMTISLPVLGQGGVPTSGVSAVVFNLTITEPTEPTFITAFPGGNRPLASNLNAAAGQTVANRVHVPVASDGTVSLYNVSGSAHLIADVSGYFTDGTDALANGARFSGITPTRLLDTREAQGPLGPGGTTTVPITGRAGLPNFDTQVPPTAAVLNITITQPTEPSWAVVYPAGQTRPLASDVNYTPNLTVPALSVVKLGEAGSVDLFNASGYTHVIIDLLGYYSGDIQLQPGAHIIHDQTAAAITSVTDATVSFLGIPSQLADLQPGDTLSLDITPHAPDGLMRLVDSIDTSTGDLVVWTRPASLDQILVSGHGHFDSSTIPDVGTTTMSTGPSYSTDDTSTDGATTDSSWNPSIERSWNFTFPLDGLPEDETTNKITGTLSVGLLFSFNVDLVEGDLRFDLSSTAKAGFTGSLESAHEIAVLDLCHPLPRINLPKVQFSVGPIPISLSPSVNLEICADISVKAVLSADVTAESSLTLGIRHNNGDTDPYVDSQLTATARPPDLSIKPNISVTPSAYLELAANGIHILKTGPSLVFSVQPDWRACKFVGALTPQMMIALQLKVWKFEATAYDRTFPFEPWPLFDGAIPGCIPGTELTAWTWRPESTSFNDDIYIADDDDPTPIRLTGNPTADRHSSLSPDGQWIAFSSLRDASYDIWLIRSDNSVLPQQLTNDDGLDQSPDWSPDGTKIVFERDGSIYVMNNDGTGERLLTTGVWPEWSVDDRIAFSRSGDIWTINADGTNPAQLTSGPATDTAPTWSPDASSIAFDTDRDGNREIYTMKADGTNLANITNHPAADAYPSWAKWITFVSVRTDDSGVPANAEIWKMDADGDNLKQFSHDRWFDGFPDSVVQP